MISIKLTPALMLLLLLLMLMLQLLFVLLLLVMLMLLYPQLKCCKSEKNKDNKFTFSGWREEK